MYVLLYILFIYHNVLTDFSSEPDEKQKVTLLYTRQAPNQTALIIIILYIIYYNILLIIIIIIIIN